MIIIPISEKEEAIQLYDCLSEKGIPVALEDTNPFCLWILTVPAPSPIEFKWARRLISEAGMDVSGFSLVTMQFMQENRHAAAVDGKCRFMDPKTWASLGNRLPIGCVPPIDIDAFAFHSEQQPTGGVYKPAAATPI